MLSSVKSWFFLTNSSADVIQKNAENADKEERQPRYITVQVNNPSRECAFRYSESQRLISNMKSQGMHLSLKTSKRTLDQYVEGCLPLSGEEIILELSRFLFMAAQRPDISQVLPREIDVAWLVFLTDTEMYENYCEHCFGKMIHHPYPTMIEYLKERDDNQVMPFKKMIDNDCLHDSDEETGFYGLYVDLLEKSVEVFGLYSKSVWLGAR